MYTQIYTAMYVFTNPFQEPFDRANEELAQLEISRTATQQRLEAINHRIKQLHSQIAALKIQLRNAGSSTESYQTLSALCEAVLAANAGIPMTVPQIVDIISRMGITLQYSNPGSALHTTLRRLGEKQESGVRTLLAGMVWQGHPVPSGPARYLWDPAYPPPSSTIPFPSVV